MSILSSMYLPQWVLNHMSRRLILTLLCFYELKVHVEFEEGRDKITLEGPPQQVEEARRALEEISRDLQSRLDFAIVKIDPKFHKHIIGKGGANGKDCFSNTQMRSCTNYK